MNIQSLCPRHSLHRAAPLAALLAALLSAIPPAFAQQSPSAGELLREVTPPSLPPPGGRIGPFAPPLSEVRPAMAEETGLTLLVRGFRISGATVFPEAELQTVLARHLGQEAGFADLRAAADAITRHYRERGYVLARAYLPSQRMKDGLVDITILEGRLADVRLENKSVYSDADILAFVAPEGLSGAVVHQGRLERRLLLLADIPGFQVNAELSPGSAPGTTDLKVKIEGGPRVDGEAGVDNHGNSAVGRYRASAGMRILNPGGWGDQVSLRGLLSDDRMAYGRAAYELSVGSAGSRVGLACSTMRYALGKEFSLLAADGDADVVSLSFFHPLLRSLRRNAYLNLSWDQKQISDRVAATATRSDKTARVSSASLSFDQIGDLGSTSASLSISLGRLDLHTEAVRLQDQASLKSAGRFSRGNLSLSHLLPITTDATLSGKISAQRASKNLDASEKFALGGPSAVRAYPQGEAAGDDAWLLSLEARQNLGRILGNTLHGSLFADWGHGRINHDGSGGSRSLSGAGLAFSLGKPGVTMLRLALAQRLSGGPATADKDSRSRVWLSYEESF